MTFPAQSTAISSAPGSLWWRSRYDAVIHVCETQGASLIRALQRVLIANLPVAYNVDGTAFLRAEIQVDQNFGPRTFAGLRRMAEDLDVSQGARDAMRADWLRLVGPAATVRTGARGMPVSLATMAVAIFVAVHRNLAWSTLIVPDDIVTMRFGVESVSDGDAHDLITCTPEANLTAGHRDTPVIPGGLPGSQTPTVGGGVESSGSGGETALLLVIALAIAAAAANTKRK